MPEKIRNEIIKNIKNKNCFNILIEKAIKKAIMNAEPNEIILIAGKGHGQSKFIKIKLFPFQIKKL